VSNSGRSQRHINIRRLQMSCAGHRGEYRWRDALACCRSDLLPDGSTRAE
jgi:hypothetical protein